MLVVRWVEWSNSLVPSGDFWYHLSDVVFPDYFLGDKVCVWIVFFAINFILVFVENSIYKQTLRCYPIEETFVVAMRTILFEETNALTSFYSSYLSPTAM